MNRKQRLAARQDDPPREERTAVDVVLIILGLSLAAILFVAGVTVLAEKGETADGWEVGRTAIFFFGFGSVGLGLAYDRLKKRKPRG